jgi:hypothetical protein
LKQLVKLVVVWQPRWPHSWLLPCHRSLSLGVHRSSVSTPERSTLWPSPCQPVFSPPSRFRSSSVHLASHRIAFLQSSLSHRLRGRRDHRLGTRSSVHAHPRSGQLRWIKFHFFPRPRPGHLWHSNPLGLVSGTWTLNPPILLNHSCSVFLSHDRPCLVLCLFLQAIA